MTTPEQLDEVRRLRDAIATYGRERDAHRRFLIPLDVADCNLLVEALDQWAAIHDERDLPDRDFGDADMARPLVRLLRWWGLHALDGNEAWRIPLGGANGQLYVNFGVERIGPEKMYRDMTRWLAPPEPGTPEFDAETDAMQASLEAHYAEHPHARPSDAEIEAALRAQDGIAEPPKRRGGLRRWWLRWRGQG